MAKLCILSPQTFVRLGIRRVLEQQHDVMADGPLTIDDFQGADVVVLAHHGAMPAIREVRASAPNLPIVVVDHHNAVPGDVLEAGATAWVDGRGTPESLLQAIEAALTGRPFISQRTQDEACRHRLLSNREREVMQRILKNQRIKEIAYQLNVSVKTVSTHRFRLLRKLALQNDLDLLRYARRHGLEG
jgi:DNA-binding NarL/FixJ family response regulator